MRTERISVDQLKLTFHLSWTIILFWLLKRSVPAWLEFESTDELQGDIKANTFSPLEFYNKITANAHNDF